MLKTRGLERAKQTPVDFTHKQSLKDANKQWSKKTITEILLMEFIVKVRRQPILGVNGGKGSCERIQGQWWKESGSLMPDA